MSGLAHWYPGDSMVASFAVVAVAVSLVSTAGLILSCGLKAHPVLRHLVLLSALCGVLATPGLAGASAALRITWFALPIFSATNEPTRGGPIAAPHAVEETIESPPARDPVQAASRRVGKRELLASRAAGVGTRQVNVAGVAGSEPGSPQRPIRQFMTGALLVWLVGTVALLLRFAASCVRVRRLQSSLQTVADERLSRLFAEAGTLLSCANRVQIGISSRVRTPVVAGWFRPAVVLPESSLAHLTHGQLRDVLVHEMAHVVRRDQLVLALEVLAQALFWPIATVHLLCRQLDCAREDVCDNFVLGTRSAVNYGETLLRLAELAYGIQSLPATTGILHWHGKLENRVAGLISKRRDTAKKAGRFTTIVVLGLFVFAGGLLSGTRIVAQQDAYALDSGFLLMTDAHGNQFVALPEIKTIDADQLFGPKKAPGTQKAAQSSETFFQADEAARPGNRFVFSTELPGAVTEPVFLDAETGRFLTPPRDLVPKEDLGKPLAKWVYPEPLKGWIRKQGIDFAAQTDNWSYITVVGFDMRGGGVLPKGVRELGPAEIVKKVAPLPLETVEWNISKSYAEFCPFVTREGSVGVYYCGIQHTFFWRDSIDFRYQLARDPQVSQLTGRPVLPVFEPAILAMISGTLDAGVFDRTLRLKLPGALQEIEVGGGQVVVRGPAGVEIRAARLGAFRLWLDGASGTAKCRGRDGGAMLRAVGAKVQIEMHNRIAEADHLSIRFPALTLDDERALSWKPAPATPPNPAEKAPPHQARQRDRQKAEEYLADMAEKGYALRPGESLRRIAPAFPAVRAKFWEARYPNTYYPLFGNFPEAAIFRWEGQKLHDVNNFIGSHRLIYLLDAILGYQRPYVSGPPGLLQTPFPGDWVVRTGAPDEAIARDLEKIVRAELNEPIHLEFRDVKRDVYVVRGRYHLTPLPGQPANGVQVYGKQIFPRGGYAGGGSGNFQTFLRLLSRWIDTPIVDEVGSPPQRMRWTNNENVRGPVKLKSREEAHDPALVLPNITRQTGLQFSKEKRAVRTLIVELAK